MVPRKQAVSAGRSKVKAKAKKQPTQVNPKGIRVKILGANGKIRWEWQAR